MIIGGIPVLGNPHICVRPSFLEMWFHVVFGCVNTVVFNTVLAQNLTAVKSRRLSVNAMHWSYTGKDEVWLCHHPLLKENHSKQNHLLDSGLLSKASKNIHDILGIPLWFILFPTEIPVTAWGICTFSCMLGIKPRVWPDISILSLMLFADTYPILSKT